MIEYYEYDEDDHRSMEDRELDYLNDTISDLIWDLKEANEYCNKWRKAFNIVMEYSIHLPECDHDKMTKRLKAIGVK